MDSSKEICEDIDNTSYILNERETSSNYDSIYTHSNECLSNLFKNFDVKNKRVLTVLSSSDQLFNCLVRNCFSVDTFDINKLTKYFYYLRKWNIIYNGKYYLPEQITGTFIYNTLNRVVISSEGEEEAYKYWNMFIRKFPGFLYKYLFYNGVRAYPTDFCLDDLKEKLSSYELSFKCMDIGSDIDVSSKYDVIITSNLSEYFFNDRDKVLKYKNNLLKLLDDSGIVISSHMIEQYIPYLENKLFSADFDSSELSFYYDKFFDSYFPLGYSYQKKKSGVNKK